LLARQTKTCGALFEHIRTTLPPPASAHRRRSQLAIRKQLSHRLSPHQYLPRHETQAIPPAHYLRVGSIATAKIVSIRCRPISTRRQSAHQLDHGVKRTPQETTGKPGDSPIHFITRLASVARLAPIRNSIISNIDVDKNPLALTFARTLPAMPRIRCIRALNARAGVIDARCWRVPANSGDRATVHAMSGAARRPAMVRTNREHPPFINIKVEELPADNRSQPRQINHPVRTAPLSENYNGCGSRDVNGLIPHPLQQIIGPRPASPSVMILMPANI